MVFVARWSLFTGGLFKIIYERILKWSLQTGGLCSQVVCSEASLFLSDVVL